MEGEDGSSGRLYWPLQLAGWSAFGIAMAFSRVGSYPLDYMIGSKAVLAVTGLLTSHGLRAIYRRALPAELSLARTVVIAVGLSYLGALVWTAPYHLIDARIQDAMLGRAGNVENVAQLFSASLYHAFALLAWSALYLSIKRHRSFLQERERALRAEALAHEARLQALRFQLRPHLLFNALNAISTLIVEQRTVEASRMISRLSDFLRQTLVGRGEDQVTLRDELAFVDGYLQIEQVRFGDRLTVCIDVSAEARDALVPTLVLQPIVENAIRHAVEPSVRGSAIGIVGTTDGAMLRVSVSDAGSTNGGGTPSHGLGGIGLRNVQDRLGQLYGDRGRLLMETPEDGGTRVTIEIPLRRAAS